MDFPKGEPENPLSEQEFRDRYDSLMEYAGAAPKEADGVYEMVSRSNETVSKILCQI